MLYYARVAPVRVYRCTSLYGTPTMFIDMLNLPNFEQFNLTSLYTGMEGRYRLGMRAFKRLNDNESFKRLRN